MTAPLPAAYEVRAFNGAAASENKIHDDTVAQRFGFRGALVPGVAVFAYMAHLPVARWGRAFLERGAADCRFQKPVYDGDTVRVSAEAEGDGLALLVESGGERCATGHARCRHRAKRLRSIRCRLVRHPESGRRRARNHLGSAVRSGSCRWSSIARRTPPISTRSARPNHSTAPRAWCIPGRSCGLRTTRCCRTWCWARGSTSAARSAFMALARIGEELTLRSRITSNTVNKGHAIVAFDAIVVADGARAVAEISHSAIWRPRQIAEAAAAASAS